MKTSMILSAVGAAALASAHGLVQEMVIDGTDYTTYNPYSDPYQNPVPERISWTLPGNGPVEDVNTSAIACNTDATAGALSADVTAGGQITFDWTTWPDSHKGPVMTYMAACPDSDCTTVSDVTTLDFFKINAAGLYDNGTWAAEVLIANNNSWTVTIPESLASGAYLIRHEILALHSAGSVGGAQFYPMCANLKVTGSGTATPSSEYLVKFPGAYSATDPGIEINIYYPVPTSYTIPGPDVWTGSDSSSGSGSGSASTSAAAGTTAAATETSAAAATSTADSVDPTSTAVLGTATGVATGTGIAASQPEPSSASVDPVAATTTSLGADGTVTSTIQAAVTQTVVQSVQVTMTYTAVQTTTVTVTPQGQSVPACTAAGRYRRDVLW